MPRPPGPWEPPARGFEPAIFKELLVFCVLFLLPCLDLDPEPGFLLLYDPPGAL